MGVKSGTQPEPGSTRRNIFYRYFTDSMRGPNGELVVLDPTQSGSQTINADMPVFLWITSKKVLGANFGMMAVMPFAKRRARGARLRPVRKGEHRSERRCT